MKARDAYIKIRDWSSSKWNFSEDELYYTFGYDSTNLILYMEGFPKWNELIKKGYNDDQLIDYFIEAIRVKLPELKNLNIDFKNIYFKFNTYKIVKI